MDQSSKWCKVCNCQRLAVRKSTNHLLHFFIAMATFGFWIPISDLPFDQVWRLALFAVRHVTPGVRRHFSASGVFQCSDMSRLCLPRAHCSLSFSSPAASSPDPVARRGCCSHHRGVSGRVAGMAAFNASTVRAARRVRAEQATGAGYIAPHTSRDVPWWALARDVLVLHVFCGAAHR